MRPGMWALVHGGGSGSSAQGGTAGDAARVKLNGAAGGVHVVTGDQPFGIQALGYAAYTSYRYPGGLALQLIAPPPKPIP